MNKQQQQQQAYGHGKGDSPYCCFHPRDVGVGVGVCAHCLKDRLLLLLATTTTTNAADLRQRSRAISLPKVFALGSSLLQRLDSRHHRSGPDAAAAANYSNSDGSGTTSAASPDGTTGRHSLMPLSCLVLVLIDQ